MYINYDEANCEITTIEIVDNDKNALSEGQTLISIVDDDGEYVEVD